MDVLTVKLRAFKPSDLPFLMSSLTHSYFHKAAGVDAILDRAQQARWLTRKFKMSGDVVEIACDPEDEDLIIGWCWGSAPILHYVFVKERYRGQGVALSLLARYAACKHIYCVHWTNDFENFAEKHKSLYWRI